MTTLVIKSKMANNGNTDDNKNKENKNNSQKITRAQN